MDNTDTANSVNGIDEFDVTNLEGVSLRRKFFFYFFLLVVFVFLFIINFLPYDDTDNANFFSPTLINSYFRGSYSLCLNKVNTITKDTKNNESSAGECVEGEMDVIILLKDVNLDGFYRIYVGLLFETDYQGKWYQFWKNKHFFSSTHKYSNIIISLSNLIHIAPDTLNTTGLSDIYLNDFVPNFINTRNKKINPVSDMNDGITIIDNGKLLNSIRLNTWNEFSHLGNIHNFNLILRLSNANNLVNPDVSGISDNILNHDSTDSKIESNDNGRKISSRDLDEFYLINMRKYVQNEYEHIANFDISLYNLFTIFSTHNFFNTKTTSLDDNADDINYLLNNVKTTGNPNTINNTIPINNCIEVNNVEVKIIDNINGNSDVLIDYFNPIQLLHTNTNSNNSKQNQSPDIQNKSQNFETNKSQNFETNKSQNFETNKSQNCEMVEGELYSNDIGIRVKMKGIEKDMSILSRGINIVYVLYIIKSLIEVLLYNKQFKAINSQSEYNGISIMTVSLMTFQEIFEIFLLLFHSNIFFSNLIYFTLILFLKFFLLTVIQHSFIILIWRSSHSYQIRQGWNSLQKSFSIFYRYYFTFMTILIIIWYYYYSNKSIVVCVVYLVWVPQIMLDVWNGQKNSLNYFFILLMIVLKLSVPFYIFYFKDNVFNFDRFDGDYIKPNPTLVYIILLLSLLQIVVILIQRLYGARYLFNWSILPKIYSYMRPWTKIMQDDLQQCNICMYQILYSNKDWCLTPCDHIFHNNCLKEWTTIKMECPNCRRQLPPIIQ